MDEEIQVSDETGLTDDAPFDINALIEDTISSIDAEDDDQDVGPDESLEDETGELTDDEEVDDSATTDTDDEDPDLLADEEEDVQDEEAAEADAAEEEVTEPETPPPPADDPKDLEIERLKTQLRDQNDLHTKLLDMLEQRAAADKAQVAPRNDALEAATSLALFGSENDWDRWNGLDPSVRKKAEDLKKQYVERETRYALNPALRYEEFRQQVINDVQAMLSPIVEERAMNQAKDLFRQEVGDEVSEVDRARLGQIYQTVPGSKNEDGLEANRQAFKIAAKLFKAEKAEAALRKEKAKVRSRAKQQRANAKAARRSAPRTSSTPGVRALPKWTPGMDLGEYAEHLETEGLA